MWLKMTEKYHILMGPNFFLPLDRKVSSNVNNDEIWLLGSTQKMIEIIPQKGTHLNYSSSSNNLFKVEGKIEYMH